jgi:pyridoxal phosphate enzyme (YggS family)
MSQSIEHNIANVRQRIRDAEKKYGRIDDSVQLMAVSKTQPATNVRLAIAAGITDVGENYLQEALDKIEQLADLAICWHFIGPIQSNKTRAIAEHFDWVHSVDRLKIAQRLNDQRPSQLPPLNICLQVNIDDETSKSGVALGQLPELTQQISHLPNIRLRGLMAIPKASDREDEQRVAFAKLAEAANQLNKTSPIDTLSMGMSKDLDAAIAEGSTLVRIGTDIFGPRLT